jgi:hypothetical protein
MSATKPTGISTSNAKLEESYKRSQMATGVHWTKADLNAIDAWIARQADSTITRKVAIRRLVEIGLAAPARSDRAHRPSPAPKAARSSRARELAAETIEKMIDPSASVDERAQRRRRLTKGPSEFREDRVDLAKAKGK